METWKAVPGFEGLYEVSDLGRVRSLDRTIIDTLGRVRRLRGVLRKIQYDDHGYPMVSLGRECARCRVHDLVLGAFVGPKPDGWQVCHRDDKKANNALTNLRYDTVAGNVADKISNGRTKQGENCHFHKVTEPEVASIRSLAGVIPQTAIAEQFGLTQQGVSDIVRRKAWRHV